MTTFLWSDLHVGHVNMATKWRPEFGGSVETHDAEIAARWRATIQPGDDIWLIGDVALGTLADSLAVIDGLPGTKHLVPGNHDRIHASSKNKHGDKYAKFFGMYDEVFTVHDDIITGDVLGLDADTLVCHFPWKGTPDHETTPNLIDVYGPDRTAYNPTTIVIHGHTHDTGKVAVPMAVHVGIDAWRYPVSVQNVQRLVDTLRTIDS